MHDANRGACRGCALKVQCTSNSYRRIGRYADEAVLDRMAERLADRPGVLHRRRESADPRWRSHSIYLFGVDMYGNTLFTGNPYNWGMGISPSELTTIAVRDDVAVAEAFGETFLYYTSVNPSNGMPQRKGVLRQAGGHLWGTDPGVRLKGGHLTKRKTRMPRAIRMVARGSQRPLLCPVEAYPSLTSGTGR